MTTPDGHEKAPTFGALLRHRRFLALWLAFLATNFGSVMLLMALALKTFADTQSSLLAGAVYASQWLLPLALLPVVGWVNSRFPIRRVLLLTQSLSIGVTMAVGTVYGADAMLFLALMAVRGLLESIMKSGASVALKQYVESPLLPLASSLYDTSRYIGAATAALAGMLLIPQLTIVQIAVIDATSFALAALCYFTLPTRRAVRPDTGPPSFRYWPQTLAALKSTAEVRRGFIALVTVTGLCQGYHNIARTTLPLDHLGMTTQAAALMQGFTSFSFLLGALFVGRFLQPGMALTPRLTMVPSAWLTALFLLGSVLTTIPPIGVASYLAFLFWFEVVYTTTNNRIIIHCPVEDLGFVASARDGCAPLAMITMIVAGGSLIDRIGFAPTTILLSCICLLGAPLLFGGFRRKTRMGPATDEV